MELAFFAEALGGALGMAFDPLQWLVALAAFYQIIIKKRGGFLPALLITFVAIFTLRFIFIWMDPIGTNSSSFFHTLRRSHAIFLFALMTTSLFWIFNWKRTKSTDS